MQFFIVDCCMSKKEMLFKEIKCLLAFETSIITERDITRDMNE